MTAGRAELEASGGVSLESVREIALSGVDFIGVGQTRMSGRPIFSMLSRRAEAAAQPSRPAGDPNILSCAASVFILAPAACSCCLSSTIARVMLCDRRLQGARDLGGAACHTLGAALETLQAVLPQLADHSRGPKNTLSPVLSTSPAAPLMPVDAICEMRSGFQAEASQTGTGFPQPTDKTMKNHSISLFLAAMAALSPISFALEPGIRLGAPALQLCDGCASGQLLKGQGIVQLDSAVCGGDRRRPCRPSAAAE